MSDIYSLRIELQEFMLQNVEVFDEERVLGIGSYGSVQEVMINGKVCAAKMIHEALLETDECGGIETIATKYLTECQLMSRMRHPNITQFIGVCFKAGSRLPLLVMERLDCSLDELVETTPTLPLSVSVYMLMGVCQGLLHLHRESVVHRDLTARNVLLTTSLRAKITDFGNSRIVHLEPGQVARTLTRFPGTLVYMAPEAVSERGQYGPSLDVFSFGVLTLFVLTQVFPGDLLSPTYPDPNSPDCLLARSEFERRSVYTSQLERRLAGSRKHCLYSVVRECLANNPEKRPTTSNLISSLEEVETQTGKDLLQLDIDRVKTARAKERRIQELQREVTELLKQKDSLLIEKDTQLVRHQEELTAKDNIIATKNSELTQKNEELGNKDTLLAQKDALLAEQHATISKRERTLAEREALIQEQREQIELKDAKLANKAAQIQQLQETRRSSSTIRRHSSASRSLDEVSPGPGHSILPATVTDTHEQDVTALCFSGDGNYMATGGADKVVRVWSLARGKMEISYSLCDCTNSVTSVQFDQHSRMVLAGANDYKARIWSMRRQQQKGILGGHTEKVTAAKFMEDNSFVVTGSYDRTLKIWELQHKICAKTLFAGSGCNDVMTGRGMGTTIISGHIDKRIRFWDRRSTTCTTGEIALQGAITSLDYFPDRHQLLCCSRENTLSLIDLRQNKITATFSADGFYVSSDCTRACFSPDGQYVAAGSYDGTIYVWETLAKKVKAYKCKEHSTDIAVCSWHPQGQLFASANKKKVVLWNR